MACTLSVFVGMNCTSSGIEVLDCILPGFGVSIPLFVAVVLGRDCVAGLTVGLDAGLTGSFVVLSVSFCLPCSSGLDFGRFVSSSGVDTDVEDTTDVFVVDSLKAGSVTAELIQYILT